MNQIAKVFQYQGNNVRTVIKDGEPWFVAKDVCDILEIANSRDALARLDPDEKGVVLTDTPGGVQEVQAVNEPGLYTLILGSRKKEAKAFKRWITHEVIPAIRKTGAYISPTSLEDLIIMQAQSVKELKAKVAQIEERTVAAHHRIDNLDNVNVIGDPQQRLNAMVRKYARDRGLTFTQAWREFRQAYNTAYHTNLTMLVENYKLKHGLRQMTMPEYLMRTGKIEDAIRVADKMLNNQMLGGDYQCLN
jgi:prophage antirepressor-like protein